MEIYHLQADIPLFGKQVSSFPAGIGEAFTALQQLTLTDGERNYYGLSKMDKDNTVLYWVAAEEKIRGEAEQYDCKRFLVAKGDYLSEKVLNWHGKTGSIKDVFHALMNDTRAAKNAYCIEWYYSEEEMLCMLLVSQ